MENQAGEVKRWRRRRCPYPHRPQLVFCPRASLVALGAALVPVFGALLALLPVFEKRAAAGR